MGMDYQYAGSASYPRFDAELKNVAKIFGGIPTKEFEEYAEEAPTIVPLNVKYWFGSSDMTGNRFLFPEGTDEKLIEWFNDPYTELTAEDTKRVGQFILAHPEIQNDDIHASQIYYEFKMLIQCNEGWSIN